MKNVVLAVVAAAGLAAPAMAQSWTYGFRLVMDGRAPSDSPANPAGVALFPYTQAQQDGGTTPTRIGFWLQARVSQTGGQNYGIGRFSSGPTSATDPISRIALTDSVASSRLSRGAVNSSATQRGRINPFRNGGPTTAAANSERDNPTGVAAFPGTTNGENGAFDQDGDRLYAIDSYVGFQRAGIEDPDTGEIANPWTILAPTGEFSPWQNLYRVYVDITDNTARTAVLNARGQLNGTLNAQQVGTNFPLQLSPTGTLVDARFDLQIVPTPGAAAVIGLGLVAAGRRRR